MQLADQKQSDRDELEPILYAALVNSMVQNFWAIFLGSASAAVAAVMTALKTGDVRLWPIAFALIAVGTGRAFQMRRYENRAHGLSFEEARHLEPRYWIGALIYAAVLGLFRAGHLQLIYKVSGSLKQIGVLAERRNRMLSGSL